MKTYILGALIAVSAALLSAALIAIFVGWVISDTGVYRLDYEDTPDYDDGSIDK